jgi:hypothetical protein
MSGSEQFLSANLLNIKTKALIHYKLAILPDTIKTS